MFKKHKIITILIIFLVLVFGYYTYEIVYAFYKTPQLRKHYLSEERTPLKWADISPRQQEIFIKVQDPNFWNHNGVEFSTPGSGWTTVSQSITKWLYFKEFKQGFRKIKQTLIAWLVVDKKFTKEEQLNIFINNVWFDTGVKGMAAGAAYFYQKPIQELTEDEYISLIATFIIPKKYNIKRQPENNARRTERIKRYLSGEYKPKGLFDILYDIED